MIGKHPGTRSVPRDWGRVVPGPSSVVPPGAAMIPPLMFDLTEVNHHWIWKLAGLGLVPASCACCLGFHGYAGVGRNMLRDETV